MLYHISSQGEREKERETQRKVRSEILCLKVVLSFSIEESLTYPGLTRYGRLYGSVNARLNDRELNSEFELNNNICKWFPILEYSLMIILCLAGIACLMSALCNALFTVILTKDEVIL